MVKVGLTGGIATGKSHVLNLFRRRGIPCLDADALSHGVTSAGTEATSAVARRFGAEILDPDGAVDRTRLGPIVFADPQARQDLEAIVHPAVYRAIQAGLRGFELTGEYPFAVVDVPLLFETGHETAFDRIVVTACSEASQIARLERRGMSEEAARQRIAAQWPVERKKSRADFVIDTDGSFEETERQVDAIHRALQGGPDG